MEESKVDALVHPVRLRIVLAVAGKQMTPQQIAAALPDVAQASLYRHINRLSQAGLLEVVQEVPVRGTVEKVYAVSETNVRLQPSDLAALTREEHLRYFTNFVTLLLGRFRAYLQQEKFDFAADGVSYNTAMVNLSDDEYCELMKSMIALVKPLTSNELTPERRRRMMATIVIPEKQDS
jgi:DNA-binding transcriptional ArsR family regulator